MGSQQPKFIRKSMKLNGNSRGEGGFKQKNLPWGGITMDIFLNHKIIDLAGMYSYSAILIFLHL